MAESNRSLAIIDDGVDNESARNVQPRQPSNLQGLLRFAMEATRNEDAHGSNVEPMNDERRAFLEEAINSISVDVTKELQDCIQILLNKEKIASISAEEAMPAEIEDAFNVVENYVSQIDVAIGFHKIGGFSIFPICLSCKHPGVRKAACNLLAELCQSNPYCQTKVLECGYLKTLINMLIVEQEPDLLLSVLYGVSCIIRHHDPCIKMFLEERGLTAIKKSLDRPISTLHTKAAFLITSIFPEHTYISNELVSCGAIESLIKALPKKRIDNPEQILCALHTVLMNNDDVIIDELRQPNHGLAEILSSYLKSEELNCENTEYVEEKFYCEKLLAIVRNKNNLQTEISIDR